MDSDHIMSTRMIIVVLVPLLLIFSVSHAQNNRIYIGYDANGNRISRTLIVAKIEENSKPVDSTKSTEAVKEETDSFDNTVFSVYPNPTHEKLTISFQNPTHGQNKASLFTLTGTLLFQYDLTNKTQDIDLSNLLPGVYLLKLSTTAETQVWKIIKN